MEEQHINAEFAVRMLEAPTALIDKNESTASDRLALLFDLIDFNSIKNICDIGSRFLEQTRELCYIFPDAKIYAFEPVSLKPQIDAFVKSQGFRELKSGFKMNFQYEGDTIYVKEGLVDEDCLLP